MNILDKSTLNVIHSSYSIKEISSIELVHGFSNKDLCSAASVTAVIESLTQNQKSIRGDTCIWPVFRMLLNAESIAESEKQKIAWVCLQYILDAQASDLEDSDFCSVLQGVLSCLSYAEQSIETLRYVMNLSTSIHHQLSFINVLMFVMRERRLSLMDMQEVEKHIVILFTTGCTSDSVDYDISQVAKCFLDLVSMPYEQKDLPLLLCGLSELVKHPYFTVRQYEKALEHIEELLPSMQTDKDCWEALYVALRFELQRNDDAQRDDDTIEKHIELLQHRIAAHWVTRALNSTSTSEHNHSFYQSLPLLAKHLCIEEEEPNPLLEKSISTVISQITRTRADQYISILCDTLASFFQEEVCIDARLCLLQYISSLNLNEIMSIHPSEIDRLVVSFLQIAQNISEEGKQKEIAEKIHRLCMTDLPLSDTIYSVYFDPIFLQHINNEAQQTEHLTIWHKACNSVQNNTILTQLFIVGYKSLQTNMCSEEQKKSIVLHVLSRLQTSSPMQISVCLQLSFMRYLAKKPMSIRDTWESIANDIVWDNDWGKKAFLAFANL